MKNFKLLLVVVASALLSVSCNEDEAESLFAETPFIVGFPTDDRAASYVTSGDTIDLNIPVILIGTPEGVPMESDVTITYALDVVNSEAVEGDQFDFASTTRTVVLPAGHTSVSIPLSIYTGNLETGAENTTDLVINIVSATSAEGVVVGAQFDTMTIELVGLCFSDLAGMYNLVTTRLDTGAIYNLTGEEITPEAAGMYLTSSTGPYNNRGLVSAGAQVPSPTPGFVFTDICDNITVAEQNLANLYSNLVIQSAAQAANSFVDENGVITIEYSITFAPDIVRPFRGVYTPL